MRNVPFSGVEWSYQMRDQGYNEKGKLVDPSKAQADEDEESKEIELTTLNASSEVYKRDTSLDFLDEEIEI
jgi:hypothetical protein